MAKRIGAKERYDAKRKGKRTRTWACVAYPDSVPSDWVQQLEQKHIPILISPLHNADVNADDSEKKDHWHIMAMWSSPASETQAHAVFDCLNGSIPVMINSSEGYARYLIHADNPEKAQYKPEDVKALSGANWYALAYTQATADMLILEEITRFIFTTGVVSYMHLCMYAADFRPDWKGAIYRHPHVITNQMRSLIWAAQAGHIDGKIVLPAEMQKLKEQDKERTEKMAELVLEGFSLKENEMRTKAGEFKD